MSEKLVTAILGVAHIHTPGFIGTLNKRSGEIQVKYVYDHIGERRDRRAKEIAGAEAISDPSVALNDPEVTSVVICAETNRHLDLAVKAANAGKHLFVEKPIGLGANDAGVIASAIKKAGVTFQTGFAMRGSGSNQFIKREVQSGNLGKITRVRYTSCHQAALDGWFDTEWRWFTDATQSGGGAMLDLGAHILDQVIHIFPKTEGEIVNVSSAFGNRGGRYGPDIDEYGTALLTFSSGAIVELEASWVDPALRSPIEVFGTEGQIQVRDGGVFYFSKNVEGADGKEPVADLPAGVPHAFELFWDALLGRALPIPLVTIDEAALGSTVMEKIYNASGRKTTTGLK